MKQNMIVNPILTGFYPDPSICRVGDDFYMVCSSFELYPGIPIFHSRDLAHWESLGYVMNKENGFHVRANSFTGGVMAPTIRYYNGIFYIICCNYSDGGNFIVTAADPAGLWSRPQMMPDVPGIDASLFIEENGDAYILGTGNVVRRADGRMDRGIYLCDFDLKNMKVTSEPVAIWDSALRVAESPEAPHLYKIGDYYYLMIAEGGTEHHHAVAVARSLELKGWYEGNPSNPVMTHRQFGYQCDLANVGHADFVETPEGNWYAVLLGSRTIDGYFKNMGREVFLCPVIWERGWPVFSPQSGRIDWEYAADEALVWTPYQSPAQKDDFNTVCLANEWCFWGTPYGDFWKVKDSKLVLLCLPRKINHKLKCLLDESDNSRTDDCVSFVGRRQTDISFEAFCKMEFTPLGEDTAGFIIMQASNFQYRMERILKDGKQLLRLVLSQTEMVMPPHFPDFESDTKETVLAEVPYNKSEVVLQLKANGQRYDFYYGDTEKTMECLYSNGDGRAINPEVVGCMTGTMVGMFASGNGTISHNSAKYDWFVYRK